MTTDAVLRAVDLTDTVASKIPSGYVGKSVTGSYRDFFAFRQEHTFRVVMRITIGSRGGVYGYLFLRDVAISPSIDSIRIGEISYFARTGQLPLAELFWKNDEKVIPAETAITEFLKAKVRELPSDFAFYRNWFDQGYFDTPADSIRGLQGGAPGLQS